MQMFDAVDVNNLPVAGAYAAYVNGEFANWEKVVAKFPHARTFGIDVLGTDWDAASIFDYEEGCIFDPAILKIAVQNRENFRPFTACVYSDEDNLPTVESTLTGIWHVIWLATLDGTIKTGQKTSAGSLIVGTQYKGGKNSLFDTSEVLEAWVNGTTLP